MNINSLQDINIAIDVYHNTALHIATLMNDYSLCSMLLLKGANPRILNNSGSSALQTVFAQSNQDLVHLFEIHGFKLKNQKNDRSNIKLKKQTSKLHTKYNENNKQSKSIYSFPLKSLEIYDAAYLGIDIKQLLKIKPDILSKTDRNLNQSLMKAAFKNQFELIDDLVLNLPSSLLQTDAHNLSAIHWAILGNASTSLEKLLSHNTQTIETPVLEIFSAVTLAAFMGNTDLIRILVSFGADIRFKVYENGIDAMAIASWMLNLEMFNYLVELQIPMISIAVFTNGVAEMWVKQHHSGSLEESLNENQSLVYHYIHRSIMKIEQAQLVLFKEQGLFEANQKEMESFIDDQDGLVYELSQRIKTQGTTLTLKLISVIESVFRLMNATIQGKKDTYILLSGDLLHQVSELTDTIQSLADSQPQIGHLTSKTHTIIFPVVFTRINAIAKELNGDLSKQVLLNTRLAMGVWPTPKSVSEIKRYSSIIARKSCDIVDLFHSSGYLKIQPTLLSINVNSTLPFQ